MKKIITTFLGFFIAIFSISAQDIIGTIDGRKIEAKIVATHSCLRYKPIDALDKSPVSIDYKEIAYILMESGSAYLLFDKGEMDSTQYIFIKYGHYVYKGKPMNNKEYEQFLYNECPDAYKLYKNGQKLSIAGIAVCGIGLGAMITSIPLVVLAGKNKFDMGAAIGIGVSGTALSLFGGLPMSFVARHRLIKSLEVYNISCSARNQNTAYLSLTASQNGLGVALNF